MKLLLPLVCCLFGSGLFAQSGPNPNQPVLAYRAAETTYDVKEFKNQRERTLLGDLDLTGLWGGPTYNYSMSGDDWAFVRGGFGGLEFGETFFLGYGGWQSREDFSVDDNPSEGSRYNFRQGGLIMAYSPGRDKAIHPRFTTIIGPGSIDVAGDDFDRDRMLIGQAMAGLELNLFQILRLGIDGGYRFANGVETGGITDQDVSGFVVQVEARFGFSW
ncbi:hypothetical protein [Neolewinella antarctica]|uniref:Outer membrane protein beta-barrel domain-containing protein n=1 Tax=Neolewinella antarctica TaxID=442734 RepID=A0ABX0XB48_9BACT|nr:hypothetical protein [Neolewinella antarctica]NJC26499.1 hypothetical protein [Neolewinella antarctica]